MKIILLGDFNINFKSMSDKLTNLICLTCYFGLAATINESTRITPQSSTCIDNIFTNINEPSSNARVLGTCMSDHLGQYIIIEFKSR